MYPSLYLYLSLSHYYLLISSFLPCWSACLSFCQPLRLLFCCLPYCLYLSVNLLPYHHEYTCGPACVERPPCARTVQEPQERALARMSPPSWVLLRRSHLVQRSTIGPECTKFARFSAVAAAIFTAPPQNRAIFKAPRCAISSAKEIASERRFSLRLKRQI